MGVANLSSMNQAFKTTFNLIQARHIMVFSSVVSKLLEIRQPHNKIILVREFTKAFETALETAQKGETSSVFQRIPVLSAGINWSHLKVQAVPQQLADAYLYKVGGELIDPENPSQAKTKFARVFERSLWQLKTPENLSLVLVLVEYKITTES